jgi:CxxC motif-containing protein (DUF1111 family)
MVSSRVAPGAYGIGILDHIPERDILALEDPMDADGDGISGRANWVWDEEEKKLSLGRMGWKAGKVNVRQQSAGAFNGDVGVTSTFFPSHDHGLGQEDLNAYPDGREAGESVELKEDELDKAVFYLNRLAVPYRRNTDQPDVMAGAKLFDQLNCSGCHTPSFEMDDSGPVEDYHRQTIHPFTDLLLHDMGEALSDHRPVFGASGNEWRTPPLWGIGLVEKVNGHTRFLHDGRARDLEEAVLWHGGEAQASQTAFKSLSADKRQQLIQFLESL